MSIRRIVIVGVGLIGGSLGKALKNSGTEGIEIAGIDDPAVLERAKAIGAIDVAAGAELGAVEGADVVVLATPLRSILSALFDIGPYLKRGALVTDVGSVKTPIADCAREVLPDHALFIGSHPMAGSESGGIDHASAYLFENATWVLCPPPDAAEDPRYADLLKLIKATGALALEMTPAEHDEIAATVSHVPQLLAVALTNMVGSRNERNPDYLKLAAGGFRDLTRIAASDFRIWRDILAANDGSILDALALLSAEIQRIRNRIVEEDFQDLGELFAKARSIRETIPKDSKGFLSPLADVYVHADDRPGWIASLTSLLADDGINIKDMELLKVREGTGGTFRLSFADGPTADAAVDLLTRHGLSAYRLD